MNAPASFKKHIARLVEKLRCEFFVNEYLFHTSYFDKIPSYERAAAAIEISPTYLEATLKVSKQLLDMWHQRDYFEIGRILTHEFAHILTEPLYLLACDATPRVSRDHLEDVRERQTQRVANVAFARIPKAFWLPETGRPAKPNRPHGQRKR